MLNVVLEHYSGASDQPVSPGVAGAAGGFRGRPSSIRSTAATAARLAPMPVRPRPSRSPPEKAAARPGPLPVLHRLRQGLPYGAIRHDKDYRLTVRARGLRRWRATAEAGGGAGRKIAALIWPFAEAAQVSAGGCNACEADVNVLNTVVFDLGRFGIQFVASPRHADGLLITARSRENMAKRWERYDAVPTPKLVIAVGACAISGGPYVDHPEVHNGASSVVPVDLYIPGCPPHPLDDPRRLAPPAGPAGRPDMYSPTACAPIWQVWFGARHHGSSATWPNGTLLNPRCLASKPGS